MQAILSTVHDCGIKAVKNSLDADAALIWSVLWKGAMASNQSVYENYRRLNKPVIIVDVGTLIRGVTWKIAVNHINGTGWYGHQVNLDYSRPNTLGITLRHQQDSNGSILIAAQHQKSLQMQGVNQEQWINDKIQQIRKYTDRPIVIRPHPRCPLKIYQLPSNVTLETPKQLIGTYDSFDIDYNCHAVVNYNSGPGIQAAIAGTRPIVDQTSLAHPVGIDVSSIEQPYNVDRQQWLVEVCHAEYTLDEIKQGLWLTRLQTAL